jgi:hypothetical protein
MFIFSVTFTCALTADAQVPGNGAPSVSEQDRARMRAERDLAMREWELRNIGKIKRVDVEVLPPKVQLAKVKEDYENLQKANNNILSMLSAGSEIDYKILGDSANDIRKRAGRLRSYMVALELVKDKERKRNPYEIELTGLKPALLSLDASIVSLISSPVFRDFGKVVDLRSSEKALDDLDTIIDLSERIRRSVERSMKSTRASR